MTAAPPLAGVIGWPIGHSRSPRLHGHWLARYRIEGYYIPIALPPEGFTQGLASLPALGFRGVNVTIPHKEAALALATEATERAQDIGAANTLTFGADGAIHADNTDAYGFIANLRQEAPAWGAAAGPALVLGAGGAARAIVAALLAEGCPEVRLANRTRARADALRDHFGPRVAPVEWTAIAAAAGDAATVVNTTSLGMGDEAALPLDLDLVAPGALVTDIVYGAEPTPFVRAARARGLAAVDGLGMLLHQAVPGFERWFGRRPEVDAALRAAVLAP
jgi:shikimate dehydrogenase